MGVLIFFILFSFSFLHTEAVNANYPLIKCNQGEPDIHSPFRLQGHRPEHCSHTTFDLRCKLNKTTIHFPAYGDLVVKSISYDIKKLNLLDPKNCVHEVFLNLNLSLTPFQYYYVTKNYTYLNCSARLSPSLEQVPCLSGSEYHVYVVEASVEVPKFCEPVKTVAIPFSYSAYISDDSFGLGLTWDLPDSSGGEAKGGSDMAYGKVLGIGLCIFVVVTVISAKTYYYSKKSDRQNEDDDDDDQVEKLLADCETMKIESESQSKSFEEDGPSK